MSQTTSIEWTNATWNPVRGCSRVSQGCVNCYAERVAYRFSGPSKPFEGFVRIANGHPQWTGKVELVEKHLQDPLHWREPKRIFVNSMSDLFHEALPDEAIDQVFAVMALCPQHTFQILTKRPERMVKYFSRDCLEARITSFQWGIIENRVDPTDRRSDDIRATALDPEEDWPLPNVWLGVSVEDFPTWDERVHLLKSTPAAIRFVSYEPALADLGCVDMDGINWLIVGGESGPGARPFDIHWARNTIAQCKAARAACFVKQLGAKPQYHTCRNPACTHPECGYVELTLKDKKGGDWSEWPEDLRVREFPENRIRPGGKAY